ncbi:hypothetical protein [Dyella sp. 20L07]|uniref:hypothetical protein n=1 Tax=Dyella sp. 20L07 TaxID=3384240 RepID=UPI003D2D64FB
MKISYNRPTSIAWSLAGAGAAWLTDSDALTNGRPAAVVRLQWLTGAQTTASVLTLRGTWAAALTPGMVGLVGLSLPIGTLITLAFRRPTDAGYTYQAGVYQQRVTQLPDGSRCAWFLLADGLDPVIGIEYRIANDVSGAALIPADSTVNLGEAWIGTTIDVPHEASWTRGIVDPTTVRRSKGGQLFGVPAKTWRSLSVRLSASPLSEVSGDGLQGTDWEQIEGELAAAGRCVVVPRWRGQTADYLQRTVLFAVASKQGDVEHLAGNLFSRDYTFEEVPA